MKKVAISVFLMLLIASLVGCQSANRSFAYRVIKTNDDSKYFKDTKVTSEEMSELEDIANNLEKAFSSDIAHNDADGLYAIGQGTDAITLGAVAGSATGVLSSMSDLSMGVFALSALFDSSHLDRQKVFRPDLYIINKYDEKPKNKENNFEEAKQVGKKITKVMAQLSLENGWDKRRKGNYNKKVKDKYLNTPFCPESKPFISLSCAFDYHDEVRHCKYKSKYRDKVKGYDSLYATDLMFDQYCHNEETRKYEQPGAAKELKLLLMIGMHKDFPSNAAIYVPPKEKGFPVPALVYQNEIHWMVKVKD